MERKQFLKLTGICINHDLTKLQEERSRKLQEAGCYTKPVTQDRKRKAVCGEQPLSTETFLTLGGNI